MNGSSMKKQIDPNKSKFDKQSITRRDIRNLLRAYIGAIALDQIWVDALSPKHFNRDYWRIMKVHYRKIHFEFIDKLLATTGAMPKKLLSGLTMLAFRRDPVVVREAMVEILAQGACQSLAPGELDDATRFFQALLESVGDGSFESAMEHDAPKSCKASMARWLKITDPLSIALDEGCGYRPTLQRALEKSARSVLN
jgi:hypothetical protein